MHIYVHVYTICAYIYIYIYIYIYRYIYRYIYIYGPPRIRSLVPKGDDLILYDVLDNVTPLQGYLAHKKRHPPR